MTCILLKRRINRFKSYLVSKRMALVRADSRLQLPGRLPGTLHVDKCILFDYRHNWNLYLYFIGVNIFDTIILLNWIISISTVNVGYRSHMLYKTNKEIDEGILNATRLVESDREDLLAAMMFGKRAQVNLSLPFSSLLNELGNQLK